MCRVGCKSRFIYSLQSRSVAWIFGIACRVRLWRQGRQKGARVNWKMALGRLVRDVILQRRIGGRGAASLAHVLLFSGFLVLFVGTTLISVEHLARRCLRPSAERPCIS